MKKTINVHVSEEKLSAIEMYLGQKNTKLAANVIKLRKSKKVTGAENEPVTIFMNIM